MAYFIRYTNNPQADLERGYSFVGYQLESTREKMFQTVAENRGEAYEDNFDLDTYMEENPDLVAQDNVTGLWGTPRSGLCGYGEYETLEAAIADIPNLSDQYEGTDYLVVYEGKQTYDQELDGQDDGWTFTPKAIAKLLKRQNKQYIEVNDAS